MTGDTINEITEIILNCEAIQQSNESEFTKEQAKISAYDEIRAVLDITFVNVRVEEVKLPHGVIGYADAPTLMYGA